MHAGEAGTSYRLDDGTELDARTVLRAMTTAAHNCGDPGLAFIDRMNRDNPTPGVGLYTSTAPCAEVGLVPGETCQFGYINLSKFLIPNSSHSSINLEELARLTTLLTRALDNALELSIDRYTNHTSKRIMQAKRKIGIGICGLADLVSAMGVP